MNKEKAQGKLLAEGSIAFFSRSSTLQEMPLTDSSQVSSLPGRVPVPSILMISFSCLCLFASCTPDQSQTHYVAKVSFYLQSTRITGVVYHTQFYLEKGTELRAFCKLGKHSSSRATPCYHEKDKAWGCVLLPSCDPAATCVQGYWAMPGTFISIVIPGWKARGPACQGH